MISDEPGEDADSADDDTVMEACFGGESAKRDPGVGHSPDMLDFPLSRKVPNVSTDMDAGTLAWFRTNHADWRQEMGTVLRAWVAARSKA